MAVIDELVRWYVLIGMGVLAIGLSVAPKGAFEKLPWYAPITLIWATIIYWPSIVYHLLDDIRNLHNDNH